jgi:DeoD family purine-nucleoside phosphorylase
LRDLIHIHQTAELAERVLLPGDPGRALRLAQTLLSEPKMLNHNRGLWGYTGEAVVDGELLSIQSTGMGGPSTAIVVSELVELGARRLMRIGTCGALVPGLRMGQLIIASEAVCGDGTSRALGGGERVDCSMELLDALRSVELDDVAEGPVVSSDLFYDADALMEGWVAAGAIAVEMEAATLFTLAALRGVQAACALLVSDTLTGLEFERIGEHELHEAERALGELAVRGLGRP